MLPVVDETEEWCDHSFLASKPFGTVRLCIDPTRLNYSLIRPEHHSLTVKYILPKLAVAKYLISWMPNEVTGTRM